MSVKVFGASDDLVIVEGDIDDEYYSYDAPCKIIFSNGMEVQFEYNKDGHWVSSILKQKPDNQFNTTCVIKDDVSTDIVEINDDIEWCILDIDSIHELREIIEEKIDWQSLKLETLQELYIRFCKTYSKEKI